MGTVKEANQDYERFVARDYRGPCPAYHLSAALQRVDVTFHLYDGVGSHDKDISGLNHTACTPAVYASQHGLPQCHARLASGWWPTFTGRD